MPDFDLDDALTPDPAPPRQLPLSEAMQQIIEKAPSTLFYPGRAQDIDPLVWCRDTYDTFVYCDLGLPDTARMESLIREKLERHPQLARRFQTVKAVAIESSDQIFDWESRTRQFLRVFQTDMEFGYDCFSRERDAGAERRAMELTLTATDGGMAITIYLFQVEGVAAYLHLYTPKALAPSAVLVPHANPGQHARLLDLDGLFGAVLKRIAPRPSVLIIPSEHREMMTESEWQHTWSDYPEWAHIAFSREPR